MGLHNLPRVFLAAVLFCAPLFAWAQIAIPPLKARVTDAAQLLSSQQSAALEQKLAALEARKGSQLVVLTVSTIQPETIDQFGIRVAEAWKIGRKGVDDGAILIIAKDDRKLRIEVGRGLEGALPDATAKRIIDEFIAPHFRKGDFDGGINAGIDRIIGIIDGEPLPAAKPKSGGATSSSGGMENMLTWGAILVVFLGGILRSIFGVLLGSIVAGVVAGVAATFLGAGVIGGGIVGVIVFVLCLIGISSLGGIGGSGSSSGGGFGGGGGDFGGGGASGGW